MIEIPAKKCPNQYGEEPIYIVREVEKSLVIDLKDWFLQLIQPENGETEGRLVLKPRREFRERLERELATLPPERERDRE